MSRLGYYILCGLLCSSAWVVYGGIDLSEPEPATVSVGPTLPKKAVPGVLKDGPSFAPTTLRNKNDTEQTIVHTAEGNLGAEKTTDIPESTSAVTPPPTPPTPKPTPPTPKPTPPTPKPTPPGPLPPPDQGTWWYTDDQTNVTCIVIQFAAQLNVTYTKSVENKTSLASALLNVPTNASVVSGSCAANDSRQWIMLQWAVADHVTNKMALFFARNDTTKNYMIQSLNVSLAAAQFVNASSNATIELSHSSLWLTPLATSYRCAVPTQLNLTASASNSAAMLTVSRLQEEAFRTKAGRGFSAARECGGGDVPDAVPIAVGCALGGLVVVVLVAYLVGRRRSAARGYLSM